MDIITLCFALICFGPSDINCMNKNNDLVATFGFVMHTDKYGMPSECDCDYIEMYFHLYTNKTFELHEQKGRITPKHVTKTGHWEVVEKALVLHIDYKLITNENGTAIKEEDYGNISLTKNNDGNITDGEYTWKHYKGHRFGEILEKYKSEN